MENTIGMVSRNRCFENQFENQRPRAAACAAEQSKVIEDDGFPPGYFVFRPEVGERMLREAIDANTTRVLDAITSESDSSHSVPSESERQKQQGLIMQRVDWSQPEVEWQEADDCEVTEEWWRSVRHHENEHCWRQERNCGWLWQ